MITEAETFKLKHKILAEIALLFEHLLKAGRIKDEAEATAIVEFVNEEIDTAIHAVKFTRSVRKFCERFPAFAPIEIKLQNLRLELLHQIGQECLDNLMEQNPERWSELSESLVEKTEENLGEWMAELPEPVYQNFVEKAYEPLPA